MSLIHVKIKKIDEEIAEVDDLKRLLKYTGDDRIISSHEKYADLKKDEKPEKTFLTGISEIDDILDGFRVGTVNIVSGPTGEGKTTFTQTLTRKFSEQGIHSVWFSFEVMPREFFQKFGETIPLFYLPKEIPENSSNTTWLKERIKEAQAKYGAKVVFIDHLHYLQDMQNISIQKNTSLYIGDLLRKLKRLSISLEVAIFLIVHVKTDAGNESHVKKYYTKDDIRDSSFVKQEADTVSMIWRLKEKTNNEVGWQYISQSLLNIDKHRRTGKVGFVKLTHENGQFRQASENEVSRIYRKLERKEIDWGS